jgi:fructoselysine-6-P-deglycase FrlB-like protein
MDAITYGAQRLPEPGDESLLTPRTLVILLGNSGSRKTSIARAVRDAYGQGATLIELSDHPLGVRDVHGRHASAAGRTPTA